MAEPEPAAPSASAVPFDPPSKADAILLPWDVVQARYPDDEIRHQWYKSRFAPVLGSPLVDARRVAGGMILLTPLRPGVETDRSFNFPKTHPTHAGQGRFTWVGPGGGVRYGTLVPEPAAPKTPEIPGA